MDKIKFQNSIARQLIGYILLFSSLLTLGITVFQLYLDYSQDVDEIENHIEQIEISALPGLTNSLWDLYQSQMQTQLNGLLQLQGIQYLEVLKDDKVFASAGMPQQNNQITEVFPMIYARGEERILIGELKVMASLDEVYQRLLDKLAIVLLSNFLKTLLVSTFIYFIFQTIVTRHLSRIARHFHTLDSNQWNVPLTLDRVEKNDELQLVLDSINAMKINLRESYVSKEYFHNILQTMSDTLIVTGKDLSIQMVNRATLKLLGYTEEELIGNKLSTLLVERRNEPFRHITILEALKKGPLHSIEWAYRTKENKVIPVLFSCSAMHNAQYGMEGIVCVAQDLTKMKELESQLIQAAKLSSLGEMATGIAHEVKQPLMIIQLNAEVGAEEIEDGNLSEALGAFATIEKQVKRATEIIQHLRNFGREASKAQYQKINLKQAIDDAFILLKETVHLESIEVKQEISIGTESVYGNMIQLEQVLSNLFINAIDSLKMVPVEAERLRRLTIRAFQEGFNLVIEVEDTGTGLPKELLEKIFDPFFTTKPAGSGTGLGLSISRHIIQEHGGSLQVKTKEEKGLIFQIVLPLHA